MTRQPSSPSNPATVSNFGSWWRSGDRSALGALFSAVIVVVTFPWFPVGSVVAVATLVATIVLLRRPAGWRGTVWVAFGISVAVLVCTALMVLGLFAWTTTTEDGGGPQPATPVSIPVPTPAASR